MERFRHTLAVFVFTPPLHPCPRLSYPLSYRSGFLKSDKQKHQTKNTPVPMGFLNSSSKSGSSSTAPGSTSNASGFGSSLAPQNAGGRSQKSSSASTSSDATASGPSAPGGTQADLSQRFSPALGAQSAFQRSSSQKTSSTGPASAPVSLARQPELLGTLNSQATSTHGAAHKQPAARNPFARGPRRW